MKMHIKRAQKFKEDIEVIASQYSIDVHDRAMIKLFDGCVMEWCLIAAWEALYGGNQK